MVYSIPGRREINFARYVEFSLRNKSESKVCSTFSLLVLFGRVRHNFAAMFKVGLTLIWKTQGQLKLRQFLGDPNGIASETFQPSKLRSSIVIL